MNALDINNINLEQTKLKTSIKVDKTKVRTSIKLDIINEDGSTQTLRIRNTPGEHGIISLCDHCTECDKTKQIEFKSDSITDMISNYFAILAAYKGESVTETIKLANLIVDKLNR